MKEGYTQVFCGKGDGKSSAALGKGLIGACNGKKVIVIQFLKAKINCEKQFLTRLEPEIKLFRFEKCSGKFDSLSEDEKAEEIMNIKNGINFAKKVLVTGECDILVLDEIIGLVDEGILSVEELISIIKAKSNEVNIYMTGMNLPSGLTEYVDYISTIEPEK